MTQFPTFYNPDRIGTLFHPDMAAIAAAAAAAELPPAETDETLTQLLLVDMQIDFCHPQGALYIPGAEADVRRTIEFIFRHAAEITHITATLDSHVPAQIFHPIWWRDAAGQPPAPFTQVTADDIADGRFRPAEMPAHSRDYVGRLEAEAKKQLTIWPYHVLIGGLGNAMDPMLWSAVMWHSLARHTNPTWVVKGTIPQSEHYSAVQPEIPVPGHPRGGVNEAFLMEMEAFQRVFIAGEAKSHCVLETVEDLVEIYADDRAALERMTLLVDCMSSVQHPAVDFEAIAQARFEAFAAAGVRLATSAAALGGSADG